MIRALEVSLSVALAVTALRWIYLATVRRKALPVDGTRMGIDKRGRWGSRWV